MSRKQTQMTGLLLVLFIIGSFIVGFIGWGSPGRQSDNDKFCGPPSDGITFNVNCGQNDGTATYCTTAGAQAINITAYPCSGFGFGSFYNEIDTKTTFTSSSFTTYTSCSMSICTVSSTAFNPGNLMQCFAFAQYSHTSITANIDVRISDTGLGHNGVSWRLNEPVASKNMTLTYMTGTLTASPTSGVLALQFAVSASTLTVWHGGIYCTQSVTFSVG